MPFVLLIHLFIHHREVSDSSQTYLCNRGNTKIALIQSLREGVKKRTFYNKAYVQSDVIDSAKCLIDIFCFAFEREQQKT